MRRAHAKEEEEGEDDDHDEVPRESEVICNCMAFFATTLVVVGELLNEHNLWAVIVIGGGLSALNVIITSAGLDAVANARGEESLPERVTGEDMQDGRAVAIELGEEEVEPRRQRQQRQEVEEIGEKRERPSRRERHKRDREKREDGKKRKSNRKKERLERREKRERRTRKKRRDEESGLYTVVQV